MQPGRGLTGQGRAGPGRVVPCRAGQGKVRVYCLSQQPLSAAEGLQRRVCFGCRSVAGTGQSTLHKTGKMLSLDPLKSVISIGNVDDTSLAVPSVNQYGAGQRRVLEQVQTIKRTKSRQFSSRSGSTSLSPTSKSSRAVHNTENECSGFSRLRIFHLLSVCHLLML